MSESADTKTIRQRAKVLRCKYGERRRASGRGRVLTRSELIALRKRAKRNGQRTLYRALSHSLGEANTRQYAATATGRRPGE